MSLRTWGVLMIALPAAWGADVCAPADVSGPYGFLLAGSSTISGPVVPVATVGRLGFDGSGKIDGVSSVNFKGLFLGNPVTGTYETREDCSITLRLQDDSGAWQKFSGKVRPGGAAIDLHQDDPQTAVAGSLMRTPAECGEASFRGSYRFSMRDAPDGTVAQSDGNGNLVFTAGPQSTTGAYTVNSDCTVDMQFELPGPAGAVKARGVVVDNGNQVLGVRSDPAQVAVARFRR